MKAFIGAQDGNIVAIRAKDEVEARRLVNLGPEQKLSELTAFEAAELRVPEEAGVHADALNNWLSERPNLTHWIRGQ